MRMLAFASRNRKELTRDPLTLIFGVGFPVVLLFLMTMISRSVGDIAGASVPQFEMNNLLPGMMVFGLSFLSLFCGMLLAEDRDRSFLLRLFSSPLKASDYIMGYALPVAFVAVLQNIICMAVALLLGASLTWRLLPTLLALLPCSLLFVSLGLLLGTLFSNNQVGGISSILINVAAWLSGTWFELKLIGGVFEKICYLLPFAHAVDLVRKVYAGSSDIWLNLAVVLLYGIAIFALATVLFKKRMKS